MKTFSNSIIILFICAVSFSACKKKNPTPNTPKGLLYLHIHTDIDTNEVDAGTVARDSGGRQFSLNVAQFYMSNIVLYKSDGTSVTTANAIVLKTIGEEEYYVGSIPTGNYTSISFDIGLSDADNVGTPSALPSGNVLSTQNPNMWFGPGMGYMFMNLQGMADTTAAQNGLVNAPFTYQTGTSKQRISIRMPQHAPFAVIANQQTFVHLIADYGKALRGVNLGLGTATPFIADSAATNQIANNIYSMFRYEE